MTVTSHVHTKRITFVRSDTWIGQRTVYHTTVLCLSIPRHMEFFVWTHRPNPHIPTAIEVHPSLLNNLPRTRVREGARREVPTTHGLHIKRGGLCGVESGPRGVEDDGIVVLRGVTRLVPHSDGLGALIVPTREDPHSDGGVALIVATCVGSNSDAALIVHTRGVPDS